jgi:hypothetical protein
MLGLMKHKNAKRDGPRAFPRPTQHTAYPPCMSIVAFELEQLVDVFLGPIQHKQLGSSGLAAARNSRDSACIPRAFRADV